jgi:hypothetical protein
MYQDILARLAALLVALATAQGTVTDLTSYINTVRSVVQPGTDLQAAIDRAEPGATVRLVAGATYEGHFTCSKPLTLTTYDAAFPDGTRAADGDALATLKSPDSAPTYVAAPGADGCTLDSVAVVGAVIAGQGNETSLELVPRNVTLRHVIVNGTNQKRAVSMQAQGFKVVDSYIFGAKALKQDSQAIYCNLCANGVVDNNDLSAAGETVMFSGDRINVPDYLPHDVTFTHNVFRHDLALKAEPKMWNVKNLFELKAARAIRVTDNLFTDHWADAQQGYAIVFTPRNSYGDNLWAGVSDVSFERNRIVNVAAGISIMGDDDGHISQRTTDVIVRSNIILVSKALGGDRGQCFFLTRSPQRVRIESNVCIGDGSSAVYTADATRAAHPIAGAVFTGNYFIDNKYGFMTDTATPPAQGLTSNYPDAVWDNNVVAFNRTIGTVSSVLKTYPAGTTLLTLDAFKALFSDYANGILAGQ